MTSIEKTTLPVSKVAIIIISVGGFIVTILTQYYTTKSAIQEGFNEVKMEIQDLRSEDKLIRNDVSDLEKRANNMEQMAMNYLKPEEIKPKSYK